ncbi:MAG: hypothetical protein ACC669_02875 [bacterium]
MTSAITDMDGLIREIREQYVMNWEGIHGWNHWMDVLKTGKLLAREVTADIKVLELFAYLHDSCRRNDSIDPQHGPRAAEFALGLHGTCFTLDSSALELLLLACRDHTAGYVHDDTTIQVCWDADRLHLPRVGITPNLDYFGTEAARRMLREEKRIKP